MIGALSARPGPGRLAVIAVAAAGACVVLASSASAAMPARGSAAVPAGSARQSSGRSLRTLVATVRVFRSATRGGVQGKLVRKGTAVSIICWTTGSYYRGIPVWYETSAPVAGYVSAFNLAAHYAPAIGVPHCLAPAFSEQFNGLEASLRIRTAPSTTAAISGYLASAGANVTIDCYAMGSPVFNDPVWYHSVSPARGYVSGRMLNTGGDPAPGVPHC